MTRFVGGIDTSIEWVGSHSAISLSRVLNRISREERSGDLQIAFGRTTKTIYMKRGSVVFAASNILNERLGESMMENGSISEREFLLASHMMKIEGRKFGESLVRMGLITREELEHQLHAQFNRIILSLFNIKGGIYSFEERSPTIPGDLAVQLSVPHLLLDGLRGVSDDHQFLNCLPSPRYTLRTDHRALSEVDLSRLEPEEIRVLRVAHHGASLENIVDEVGAELGRVLRICGALCVLGLLESEDLSDSQANLAQLIKSSYSRSENMSEAQLLGVRPEAGRQEIDKSYLLKRLEWTHVRKAVCEVPSLEQMASEILFRLAAAYNHLVSANKLTPPGGRYPNELPTAELDQLAPTEPGCFAEGGEAALNRWKNHKSDDLIRDVKLHVQARDWGRAIPLLFVLVEREPTNAHYRGLLAKAMFRHPTMRKNAGRHFQEAIRLAPNNSDLHLWLGLYCKTFGLGSRAVAEFRTALELDPNNQMAKKHLLKDTDPAGYIPNPFRKMSIH